MCRAWKKNCASATGRVEKMDPTGGAHPPLADSLPAAPAGTWRATPLRILGVIALIVVVGGLIVSVAAYLTIGLPHYNSTDYLTIQDLQTRAAEMTGRAVRITGVVLGQSIQYKPVRRQLTFDMVNITNDPADVDVHGGILKVRHDAVSDPGLAHIKVTYTGALPRLMKDESQVILTGKLAADGTFIATALALKSPTP